MADEGVEACVGNQAWPEQGASLAQGRSLVTPFNSLPFCLNNCREGTPPKLCLHIITLQESPD